MLETCLLGSVRGALSNGRPYRDQMLATLILLLGSMGWIIWDLIAGMTKVGGG